MGIGTSISGSGGITLVLQTVFIFLALLPLPSITLITSNPNLQSHDPSLSSNNLTLEYPHPLGSDHNHYTDQWVLHIPGGSHRAHHIAAKHGFTNAGHMFTDYYHFIHPHIAKRSISPRHDIHELLTAEPGVRWHAQQTIKSRVKRDFLDLTSSTRGRRKSVKKYEPLFFNDPRWSSMWYLNRGPGLDMNVQEAWELGITGKGIVVTILDDGLEKDHPDIIRNYDPIASFDVNSLDMDPMPTYDLTDSNRHGTRCAGEVAAEANNNLCSVGIAYEASVGGVRMLDGDVTDAVEARSLSHSPQHVDIYSASWGPDDDGKTVDGPGELATRAFIEGITKGRQGKGSIFVWASGNGGRDHDNCNCDGYTNSIWTLSISSATENGLVPWYSEACSSTLATTYSSGGTGEKQIVTIDLHHSCTSSHTGTSASAPLAAGICALALQANTNLTWRDMQHIVVRTARPQNLFAPDWATNGIGRNVSHSFGYGLMDAGAMVKLAKKWINVPEQNKCEVRAPYTDKNIPAKSKVTLELKVTDCPGVNFLEHVQAKVTLISGRRGDLQIYLISPSGTKSVLLAHRRHDLNRSGFTDWPFMSVHCWGENPVGKWILEIHNEGRYAGRTVLKRWSLVLYGTEQNLNNELPTESKPKLVIPVSISPILTTASNKLKPIYPKTTRKPVIVKEEDIPRKPSRQRPFKTKVFTKKQKTMTQNGSDIDGDFRLTSTAYNPFGFSHVTKSTNTKPTRETVTAIPENFNSSTNEDIEGKLQTWSLVAHGITEDPNNEENIEVKPTAGIVLPPFQSINPSLIEFDGSENKIVVDTSNIHNPPHLSSSATEVADIPGILTSSANTCIKESSTGNCLACAFGFVLFKHTCILTCPDHYFAKLKSPSKEVDVPSKICLPCHSSCKTCSSSSDMSCLSCENGFTLMKRIDEKNRVLLRCNLDADLLFENNEIDYMNYWYKVLVIISLLTASIIVLVLISCYWKKNLESPSLFNSWLEKRSYIPVSPNDDGDASPMNAIEVDVDVTYASQIHSTKELNLNPETIPFTNPENTSIT